MARTKETKSGKAAKSAPKVATGPGVPAPEGYVPRLKQKYGEEDHPVAHR